MSIFLLIHGAWHGGWCYSKVVPLLEQEGHTVLAPDLPGHGADRTPTTTVTLKSYADRICEIAAAQAEPVILAGHSMGGVAITQAAEYSPQSIRSLVYLCAFLPRDGDSLVTWAQQDHESGVNPKSMDMQPDGSVLFRKQYCRETFYGACSEADVEFATSRLVPQSTTPFGVPVETTAERWGSLPRYYIECLRDRALTLTLQRAMQAQSPCRETFAIDTDHSPFLSTPQELADILLRIAAI